MTHGWTTSFSGPASWVIPVGDDPNANAWKTAVISNGGTVSAARLALVGTLIQGLKLDGLWSKLNRLWLFAGENAASARTDIVATQFAGIAGAPTFTVDRGYAGTDTNPATNYLGLVNLTSLGSGGYGAVSGHLSAWITTNTATVNGGACIGGADATNRSELYVAFTDGNIYTSINDTTTPSVGTAPTRVGHWLVTRPASGSARKVTLRNGNVFDMTFTAPSAGIPNIVSTALATNANGTVTAGNPNTHAMVSIGGGFTETESGKFYSRLRDYMNAVGVP